MIWNVYIVKCADGSLYTGIALEVEERIKTHNSGKGAKYTRSRLPVRLVYREYVGDKGDALRRELDIKKLTPKAKHQLIAHHEIKCD